MIPPLKTINYIIIHELCHMHYRDHSDLFWNGVDKVVPDCREQKAWLKKYGAGLEL
jgi:predicted metal-dependent hydrolase